MGSSAAEGRDGSKHKLTSAPSITGNYSRLVTVAHTIKDYEMDNVGLRIHSLIYSTLTGTESVSKKIMAGWWDSVGSTTPQLTACSDKRGRTKI
jgi:hypothetical protein